MSTMKQLRLDESAAEYLLEAGGERGQGDFVDALISAHQQRWRAALHHLRHERGLSLPAIRAALDAGNGLHAWGYDRGAGWLRANLVGYPSPGALLVKHGATVDQWQALLEALESPDAGRAMLDLLAAFWGLSDAVLERAIGSGA